MYQEGGEFCLDNIDQERISKYGLTKPLAAASARDFLEEDEKRFVCFICLCDCGRIAAHPLDIANLYGIFCSESGEREAS